MALKASPEDQERLLVLQEHDTSLARLAHRAKTLPEHARLTALAAEVEELRANHAEKHGAAEDARLELGRVESDVAVVEARIARDSERLQSSSSVKDVAALEQELTSLRSRLNDLEEIQLAVMQQVEDLEAEVAASTAALDQARAGVAETEAARDAALAQLEAERVQTEAARQELVGRIPAELLALYEKQRARYGTGASLLRGGVSEASGVRLLENELAAVRAAAPDDVLLCPSSEAILVRTSESGL